MAAHQLSNRLVSLFRTSLLPRSLSLPLRRPLATTTRTAWSSPSRLFSISPFRPDSQAGSGIKATWQPAEGNDSKGPLKFDQTPRLSLTFTCTAEIPAPSSTKEPASPPVSEEDQEMVLCNHRSTHQFSKQAYTQGIVLVQCPGCENRHLIADHLGWFKEITEGQSSDRLKTIEDIMREKGEVVKTGVLNENGVTEVLSN